MTNTDQVREACVRLGRFTRSQLLDALPEMEKESVYRAFDGLAKGSARAVPGITVPTVIGSDGRTVQAKVYEWVGFENASPDYGANSTLRDVQPRATRAMRSKTAVQRKASGYAPGHFTQDMTANNWPPGFVSRIVSGPAPVSSLQTIARRESDSATGKGCGDGTQVMAGTPTNPRPQMMRRAA